MLNVKDPGKYTRSVRPLVPRSPEEQLALYARGSDDLDAALAGLSREDLDQVRAGQWTIRQIVEHVVDEDARWTMCMQVALARPGYTYGHEWVSRTSRTRTGTGAGCWDDRAPAIAPMVTLLRTNRAHMLEVLHHLPAAWNRYVTSRLVGPPPRLAQVRREKSGLRLKSLSGSRSDPVVANDRVTLLHSSTGALRRSAGPGR